MKKKNLCSMLHVGKETDCQNDQLEDQKCARCQTKDGGEGNWEGEGCLRKGRTSGMEIREEETK